MPETFLILLAGGVMLAAAVVRPANVTLHWLRLAGIIALTLAGLALFFYLTREDAGTVGSAVVQRVQLGLMVAAPAAVLGQLAFVQVARRRAQRAFAAAAFVVAVLAGSNVLHEMMVGYGTHVSLGGKSLSVAMQTLACAGAAAVTGLALMDMLLGHAYLTASKMTVAPFRRLNLALAAALGLRIVLAAPVALLLHQWRPVEMLWGVHGLLILTRWGVGLAVPAVFVYMAHDCIRRRSTQAATGILYVTGVLAVIGEMVALQLVRATGLPF